MARPVGNEQEFVIATGESVVGPRSAKGNGEDVVSIGINNHHAVSIADVDIAQFIHGHAISSPFGKWPHVGERAVRIDVKDQRSTFAVARPPVYVEFLSV